MNRKMFAVAILLVASAVFAGEIPQSVKYFADWIPQLEFDSTNDCYVAQYDPAARQPAYVYRGGASSDPQKVHPGGTCFFARGEKVHFTQHAGVGCTLTYTNKMSELNGVRLPAEFRFASRQLLISGRVASKKTRDVFEKYAFVVNAAGEAYDVTTRTKFHFGIPFHAPEDTSPPRIDRSVENIQQAFCKEGVEVHKKALSAPDVMAMMNVVKEGVTNVVPFVEEIVGLNAEEARKCLRESNSDYAALIRKMESRKRQVDYVAFCTREDGSARIAAVARLGDGPKCRMWSYEGRGQVPTLIYSWTCQGRVGSYYEYNDNGLLRNLCLFKDGRITSYSTIRDGVLQKSSDMQKAQEFVSKVETMFHRYVELDTTGTLKPFVEMLKAQANDTHLRQERVRVSLLTYSPNDEFAYVFALQLLELANAYAEGNLVTDSPGSALTSSVQEVIVSDAFEMFLMFKPASIGAIPVPLKRIAWHWGGHAIRDGDNWVLQSYENLDPVVSDTILYPSWSRNALSNEWVNE